MKTYTTVQGDLWDDIAYKQLGGTRCTDRLMMANRAYIGYVTFPAGITLVLPEIPEDAPAADTMPPWKR